MAITRDPVRSLISSWRPRDEPLAAGDAMAADYYVQPRGPNGPVGEPQYAFSAAISRPGIGRYLSPPPGTDPRDGTRTIAAQKVPVHGEDRQTWVLLQAHAHPDRHHDLQVSCSYTAPPVSVAEAGLMVSIAGASDAAPNARFLKSRMAEYYTRLDYLATDPREMLHTRCKTAEELGVRLVEALRRDMEESGRPVAYGYYHDLIRFSGEPKLNALDGTEAFFPELFDWRPALPHLLREDLGTAVKRLGRLRPPSGLMPTGLRLSDDLDAHQADLADKESLFAATVFVAAHTRELMTLRTRVADFIDRATEEIQGAASSRGTKGKKAPKSKKRKPAKKKASSSAGAGRKPLKPTAESAAPPPEEAGAGASSSEEDEPDGPLPLPRRPRAEATAPRPPVKPAEPDSGPSVYHMAQSMFRSQDQAQTLVGEGANIYTLCGQVLVSTLEHAALERFLTLWDRGTFATPRASAAYHLAKHGLGPTADAVLEAWPKLLETPASGYKTGGNPAYRGDGQYRRYTFGPLVIRTTHPARGEPRILTAFHRGGKDPSRERDVGRTWHDVHRFDAREELRRCHRSEHKRSALRALFP